MQTANTSHRRALPSIDRILQAVDFDPTLGRFYRKRTGRELRSKNTNGYVVVKIDGIPYVAHRLVWLLSVGEEPTFDIDHINRDRSDNRPCNLRLATPSQNAAARIPIGASGYKGVSRVRNHWCAAIKKDGVRRSSYHRCPTAAAMAYDAMAIAAHGAFAVLNFPRPRSM